MGFEEDFPLLGKRISGKKIIYFDNACSTLRPKQVSEAMQSYFTSHPGCGGQRSSHYFSKQTELKCRDSRKKTASFIGAKENEVVWAKNSTEAINLVANTIKLKKGENVVCSVLDHHSLLLPFQKRCLEEKAELRIVECKKDCTVTAEAFSEKIDSKTVLVGITHSSNVTGADSPAKKIVKAAHDAGALAFVDGAQFVPHHELNVKKLNPDFYCFSMHKMLGPSLGVLYGKEEVLEELGSFMVGGDTVKDVKYENGRIKPAFLPAPKKFEAGLQDYAGIIGSAAAIDFLEKIGFKKIEKKEKRLSREMLRGLQGLKNVKIVGPPHNRSSVFSLVLNKKTSPKDIAEYLDTELESHRIMTRAGAHCANPLHYFIGLNPGKGEGTLRASLYFYNSVEEARIFSDELSKVLEKVN